MSKLTVLYENQPSRKFRIKDVLTIGRDANNDIQIIDVKVSRRHSIIENRNGFYIVRDLNSRNGTYLNGLQIQESELTSGDRIRVGDTEMVFEDSGAIDEDAALKDDLDFGALSHTQMKILDHTFELKQLADIVPPSSDQPKLRSALAKLSTLFEVSNLINTIRDSSSLLNAILDQITNVIKADRSYLLLKDKKGELVPAAVRTYEGDEQTPQLSQTLIRLVMEKGNSILSPDAFQDERFKGSESIFIHSIRAAMCVPVRSGKKILGLIHVDSKGAYDAFTEDDLKLLTAIGVSAGISIENLQLYEDLKRLFRSMIKSLVATIEANDQYTGGHSVRVAEYSKALAECMGLSDDHVELVELSAYLHDIGKVGIPYHILNKPGKFTDDEFRMVQSHPATGAEILSKTDGMEVVARIVRHHHERYDGSGYPDGLSGEAIPLESRILCVADTLDAITTDRSYRKGSTVNAAVLELYRCSGTQFDPDVVKVLKKCVATGKFA